MTPIITPARQRVLLIAGGLVYAVGNLVHPLEHSTTTEQSGTWVLAHMLLYASVFGLAAGLPVLRSVLAPAGRVGIAGLVGFWAGTLSILPSTVYKAFIAPQVDGAVEADVVAAMLPSELIALPLFVGGGLLLGIAALRAGLPRWFGITWIGATIALLVGPAVVSPEGLTIIPATAAQGLTVAALAWRHVAVDREPVAEPDPAPVPA